MAAVAAHQTQANPFDDSDDDDDQGVPPPPPGNPIGSPSPSNALSQDYSFGGDDDAAHNAIDPANSNGKIQQNNLILFMTVYEQWRDVLFCDDNMIFI